MVFLTFSLILSLFTKFKSFKVNLNYEMNHSSNIRQLSFTNTIYTNNTYYLMTIPLCLGLPKQCFNLIYETASHYTFVYNSTLNMKIKHTYYMTRSTTKKVRRDLKVEYLNGQYGNEINDIVSNFTNDKNKLFSFLLVNNINYGIYLPYDGAIGLARKYNSSVLTPSHLLIFANEEYSLIDYLFREELINKKVFAHKIFKKAKTGIFYIGEEGTSSINEIYPKCSSALLYKESCYSSYWNCKITNIYIEGKDVLKKPLYSIFDTRYYYILIPQKGAEEIYSSILGKDFFSENCRFLSLKEDGMGLFCQTLPDKQFSDITITTKENFNLTIDGSHLFMYTHYEGMNIDYWGYQCLITSDYFHTETMILGKIFIENYHMIFNMEDNTVGFISMDKYLDQLVENKGYTTKLIFLILFLIMIIFGVYLLVVLLYQQNKST